MGFKPELFPDLVKSSFYPYVSEGLSSSRLDLNIWIKLEEIKKPYRSLEKITEILLKGRLSPMYEYVNTDIFLKETLSSIDIICRFAS